MTSPLLLVGEEGVGRKFSVVEAIKEIVSTRGGSASALQVAQGVHPDVIIVEPLPGKDLGVEPIREIIERSTNLPVTSPNRFFVVDGADKMTPAAANAILKTLEEPPALSRFFLLAESYDRVIPTIRSRCGRVNFQKLPESFILERLSRFEKDADKALVYARMGEGSVGRAARYWGSNRIAIRDQAFNMLQSSVQGDLSSAFSIIDDAVKELPLFLRFLVFLVHDILVTTVDPLRVVSQDILEDLQSLRSRIKAATLSTLWSELKTVWERYESSYINLGFQLKSALATAFVGE